VAVIAMLMIIAITENVTANAYQACRVDSLDGSRSLLSFVPDFVCKRALLIEFSSC
jgi:hypothetical protein